MTHGKIITWEMTKYRCQYTNSSKTILSKAVVQMLAVQWRIISNDNKPFAYELSQFN